LVGTAIATLGSVTLVNVLFVVEVWYWQGVHGFGLPIVKPLIAAAVTLVAELAVARLVEPVAVRVALLVLVGLTTYLAVLLALGLAPEERRLLARLRTRIAGRFGR
jgi:hypothetical protein